MIPNKTTWIILTALILANVAMASTYGFFVYKISLERERIDKNIVSLVRESRRESDLEIFSSVLKSTEEERTKINSYFVNEQGTAHFLEELQSFGEKAGIIMDLNDVGIESKDDLRVNLSGNGSFVNMYKFVELLENTPYAISLRSFNLNKVNISSKGAGSGQIWSGSFSVHLNSFSGK